MKQKALMFGLIIVMLAMMPMMVDAILILNMTFDDSQGTYSNTFAQNLVLHGINGTVTKGASGVYNGTGNYLDCNGTGYVTMANFRTISNDAQHMSFMIWMRADTKSSSGMLGTHYDVNTGKRSWSMELYPQGHLKILLSTDGNVAQKSYITTGTAKNASDGNWHLVGFTFQTNEADMYFDGTNITTFNKTNDNAVNTLQVSTFTPALCARGNAGALQGQPHVQIKYAKIYNSTLTPSEVLALYNSEASTTTTSTSSTTSSSSSTTSSTTTTTLHQANLYVSQSGSDSNSGADTSHPIKTITKLNTFTKQAGDTIYFNGGDTWRFVKDAYISLTNGTSGNNITYKSYGTAKPIFLGSHDLSNTANWSNTGTNLWTSSGSIGEAGNMIFNNDASFGTKVSSSGSLNAQGKFYADEGNNKVIMYSTSNPASYYSHIEVAVQDNGKEGMIEGNIHYVVFKNLQMKYGAVGAIDLNPGSHHVSFINNTISYMGGAYQTGTLRYGGGISHGLNGHDIYWGSNKINQTWDAGITFQSWLSAGDKDEYNMIIEYNILDSNAYGIEYFSSSSGSSTRNVSIRHNTIVNSGYGWSTLAGGNSGRGMRLDRSPTLTSNFTVKDNIIYHTSYLSQDIADAGDWYGTKPILDYNLYYQSGTNMFMYDTNSYTSLALFRAAVPTQEAHGLQSDPIFNTATYQPRYNSPACTMSSTGSYVGALPCESAPKTYYISNTGSDANNGSSGYPMKTITKLNTLALYPGDTIKFNKGDTWRLPSDAYLTITSGNSTRNITYTAYGTGNKPRILGSFDASNTANWTASYTGLYKTTFTIVRDVGLIVLNNDASVGIKKNALADIASQGDFWYNTTDKKVYMKSSSNPATYYSHIEVATGGTNYHMIELGTANHLVFSNLSIKYNAFNAFDSSSGASYLYYINNDIMWHGGAFQPGQGTTRYGNCVQASLSSNHIYVIGNNISNCYDAGITSQAWDTGTGRTVSNNFYQNNLIDKCEYGIEYFNSINDAGANTHNITITGNTITNAGRGWSYNQRTNYGANFGRSIILWRTPTATTGINISNNIFYDASTEGINLGSSSTNNWKGQSPYLDYNLHYRGTGTYLFKWNTTYYTALSTFVAAKGKETHGQEANPSFKTGTVIPTAGSPACTMSSTGSYVGALPCESNVAPTKPSTPTFTDPATAYTNSNLTISDGAGSTDANGDGITYYYIFNDTSDSVTLQTWSTNQVFDCDTVGCNKGDIIRGYVKAYDGASYSTTSDAATITIQNTVPTQPSTPTFTSPATAYTNSNLTLSTGTGSTDLDADTIIYQYRFNDTSDSSTLQDWSTNNVFDCDTAGCNRADTIKGYTRAFDSAGYSDISSAATILINNMIPVTSDVHITPIAPGYKDTTLTLVNTTIDPEGDTLTYSIRWYINGTQATSWNNNTKITSGINAGESYIVSLRVYDTVEWTTQINSSQVTISDTYAPVYVSESPSSGTQNTPTTIYLTFLDASDLTSVTFSLRDPTSNIIQDDEPMTLHSSVANANGTKNMTYKKAWTPLMAGSYTIINKTATDSYSNILTDTTPISITASQEVSGGGGGGGGGATPTLTYNFTLTPTVESFSIGTGVEKTLTLKIKNNESRKQVITLTISGNDESRMWTTIASSVEVESKATKEVPIKIAIPKEALKGDYTFTITAKSGTTTKTYKATISVSDSLWQSIKAPIWSKTISYEPIWGKTNASASSETVEPKTKTFNISILNIAVTLLVGIVIVVAWRKLT